MLLNAFATNVRLAQSRGVEWLRRAEEIAKLTALKTEFPALAADLALEPRLPRFSLTKRRMRRRPNVRRRSLSDTASMKSRAIASDTCRTTRVPLIPRWQVVSGHAGSGCARGIRSTFGDTWSALAVPELRRDLLYLEAAGEIASRSIACCKSP